MTVGEAHSTLSFMIGDPVVVSGSTVPNGVRFSRALRDSYLHRAMTSIIARILKDTIALPRQQRILLLERTFPTFRRKFDFTFTNIFGDDGLFYQLIPAAAGGLSMVPIIIYSVVVYLGSDPAPINIEVPVVDTLEIKRRRMRSMMTNHMPNSLAALQGVVTNDGTALVLYPSPQDGIQDGNLVMIEYLPVPTHPNTQAGTALIDFEGYLMEKVFELASLYASMDSQDTDATQTAMLLMQQGG